ncbi:MAG: xanthine dehydrogenase large subunit [Candidatus Azotimanducaceae bacterium]|jgi:xanthine dehydrogenase large subunit
MSQSQNTVKRTVGKDIEHESAIKHVTGRAHYIDDIPEVQGTLHVAVGMSPYAKATIKSMDLSKVRQSVGVVDVITADDVQGSTDVGPVYPGDQLLAKVSVEFVGQAVFAVAANSLDEAKRAVLLADIEYDIGEPILSIQDALERSDFLLPTRQYRLGDAEAALANAPHRLKGEQLIRGQEHFYLEGQIAMAIPGEDGSVFVYSSTQHPTEGQKLIAKVLGIDQNLVQVETRRMGGGFGGKETQAAPLGCLAALFAVRTGKAAKYRMPRQDDMVQTGKRHDFWNRYDCSFDDDGQLRGVKMQLAGLCGCTADLSEGIVDRAMFHADNAYFLNNAEITGYRCKTNTVSNTAFRGFGGPQGMMLAESMMDDIARHLELDPLDVRKTNLYSEGRSETPYHQQVEQHVIADLMDELESTSQYRQRRADIKAFNAEDGQFRKGLALTPVKFGISFTAIHLNQAGALVHVYTDGSILVNHGGTEMGQGLHTKICQVVAEAFGVSLDSIRISASRTDKVNNTSPTAASAGTDLNGMAALDAVNQIKTRMAGFLAEHFDVPAGDIEFNDDQVSAGDETLTFVDAVKLSYMNRVQLWASGFYKTPDIHFDKEAGTGTPFYYFAHGAAVSEVVVDTLTGEYRVTQVDILQDVGDAINPAIDIGQIEGGFVQGMGWLTTEEILWDDTGRLISNSPANYKIPTAYDVPDAFNVRLYNRANHKPTIYRSKAVGEPPLMLAISVWCALRDACASVADYRFNPLVNSPATPEQVYYAIQSAKHFIKDAKKGLVK